MRSGMAMYPDDILSGPITPIEQKTRRREEISNWLGAFAAYCEVAGGFRVCFADDSAEIINSTYWEAMDENVRPRIQSSDPAKPVRADRHKIASLMELVVMHFMPVQDENRDTASDLNARLAFFIAMNIIGNWNKERVKGMFVSESFDREHRTWLRQLHSHSEGWPIFSNAATWYLVECIYFERSGTIGPA